MKNIFLTLAICAFFVTSAQTAPRDTLRITVAQADSMFLQTNYQVLAAMLDIEARKADILQARLYPNPVATADINAIDPENDKTFHVGRSGQKVFQIDQLIILGGKRRTEIEMAKNNASVAELMFTELVRQLKFELHASMHSLNQQYFLIRKYSSQLDLLNTILVSYENQAKRGNLPLKDVVRLKGIYLQVNNVRAESLRILFEELNDIQTILQTDMVIVPQINESSLEEFPDDLRYEDLEALAFENRPDYRIAEKSRHAAELFAGYQKKLTTPDMNLFLSYDQRGGAFQNQVNIGVSVPLPLWNRNQGGIRSSKFQAKQAEMHQQDTEQRIKIQIRNNLALYLQILSEYQNAKRLYNEDFDITLQGMYDNFQKRNVGLLEFVDFFEAYNNAVEEVVRTRIQLAVAAELLSFTIGKNLFR